MPQYTPLQDNDVIPEGAPPAGVKYKPVIGKQFNATLARLIADSQATPDINEWGPEATRRLYNQARDQINASAQPPEKKKALLDNVTKLVNAELSAVKAPPILSVQANNAFAQTPLNANGFIAEKSSKPDFKYAEVKPEQVTRTAENLVGGKRDEVAGTIKPWGGNSLTAMLDEYRDHLWPEDLKRATQAMDAIGKPAVPGQPGFAEQLKTIQSPELKALVQVENDKFNKAKAADPGKPADAIMADINYDFNYQQTEIYGRGISVYNKAADAYQAQEAAFYQQKLAQTATVPTPAAAVPAKTTPAAAVTATGGTAAPAGSPLEQMVMKFARDSHLTWPTLDKLDGDSLDTLRRDVTKQVKKDYDSARDVARLLLDGADPHKIDDIQNPEMKKIVDRDIKAGATIDAITEDLDKNVDGRMHYVNQQIDMTTPAAAAPPAQKLAAVQP